MCLKQLPGGVSDRVNPSTHWLPAAKSLDIWEARMRAGLDVALPQC